MDIIFPSHVTEHAVDSSPEISTRPVASNATFHSDFTLEIAERSGDGFHQIPDLAMTGLAQDPAGQNVTAMGKVDMIGDSGHTLPGNRLSTCEPLDKAGFLRALTNGLIVTIGTHFRLGNGGMIRGLSPRVAFGATHPFLFDMYLVGKDERLTDFLRLQATRNQQDH